MAESIYQDPGDAGSNRESMPGTYNPGDNTVYTPSGESAGNKSGGGGGGGGGGGYRPSAWTGILDWGVPSAPRLNAPRFAAPSLQDAMNEPGYQFRLKTGTDALEKSAAARGVLRTGGTLKDIQSYGQNFATQEYQNVFNRAMQAFDRNYRAVIDEYAPLKDEWKEQANKEKIAAIENFNKQFSAYELGEHNKAQAAAQQASILGGLIS